MNFKLLLHHFWYMLKTCCFKSNINLLFLIFQKKLTHSYLSIVYFLATRKQCNKCVRESANTSGTNLAKQKMLVVICHIFVSYLQYGAKVKKKIEGINITQIFICLQRNRKADISRVQYIVSGLDPLIQSSDVSSLLGHE